MWAERTSSPADGGANQRYKMSTLATKTIDATQSPGCREQRPCSAFLELADALELSALSRSDEGDKESAKLDMGTAHALRALVTALTDANDQCRSAMAIAQRSGEATNWPAFAYRMGDSLKRQHAVMCPPNDKDQATRGA